MYQPRCNSSQLIDTPAALHSLLDSIGPATVIGVDMEADGLHHYPEKVCLIQIATDTEAALLDPLALTDLSALGRILKDPGIRKVFHGADYDIRSLYRDFRFEVNSLFDTQVASRFLGIRRTGLADLIQTYFHVTMEKKYQKHDWSRRPLPEKMRDYALEDVIYLTELAAILERDLRKHGRLDWAMEECRIISRVRPKDQRENGPLFIKVKGAGKLDPRSLAVLEALLEYREELAYERNRPPFQIFQPQTLLQLAQEKPCDETELIRSGALSAKQIRAIGAGALQRIREARDLPENRLPRYPRKQVHRSSAKEKSRFRRMKEWRDFQARHLDMDPALIAANDMLRSLAARNPQRPDDLNAIDGMREWQKREFGASLLAVLNGKTASSATNKR